MLVERCAGPRACKAREPKSPETYGHMFVGGLDTNDQDDAGDWDGGGYIDERTGLELDLRLTKRAEKEEIEFMKKICLYDEVGNPEYLEKTGKPPISTKLGQGE